LDNLLFTITKQDHLHNKILIDDFLLDGKQVIRRLYKGGVFKTPPSKILCIIDYTFFATSIWRPSLMPADKNAACQIHRSTYPILKNAFFKNDIMTL